MRVRGKVGFQPLHILVDLGSTHNFLNIATTKKLRCKLLKIPLMMVVVAVRAQIQYARGLFGSWKARTI